MTRWFGALALALLFAASSGAAQENSDFWDSQSQLWTDEDLQRFQTDNFAEDDFGLYDEDFVWETEDRESFVQWYEDTETDWTGYDDAGDAGWFDI